MESSGECMINEAAMMTRGGYPSHLVSSLDQIKCDEGEGMS